VTYKGRIDAALDLLKSKPVKQTDFLKVLNQKNGSESVKRLVDRGIIEKYIDINPDYALSMRGQKPMCTFIRKGKNEYEYINHGKKLTDAGLQKRIKYLESLGYKVIPPDVLGAQ
jgi:hypothetical protein